MHHVSGPALHSPRNHRKSVRNWPRRESWIKLGPPSDRHQLQPLDLPRNQRSTSCSYRQRKRNCEQMGLPDLHLPELAESYTLHAMSFPEAKIHQFRSFPANAELTFGFALSCRPVRGVQRQKQAEHEVDLLELQVPKLGEIVQMRRLRFPETARGKTRRRADIKRAEQGADKDRGGRWG